MIFGSEIAHVLQSLHFVAIVDILISIALEIDGQADFIYKHL